MKKLLLFFLITIFSNYLSAQVNIKIIVYAYGLSDSEKVCITGNLPELGNWNPSLISLNKINDNTFSKSFQFPEKRLVEFKFTKGNWNNEALDSNNRRPDNFKNNFVNDTTIFYTIKNWGSESKIISGKITGEVRYHKDFNSMGLLPRDIIVWLPPSYDSLIEKRYPVLYLNDGQNSIDPKTSAFGIDWQIDETADSLIKSGAMQEIIIVGIYNTANRSLEYSESKDGYTYLKFITTKLKPFIDSIYRTLPDNKNTAIAGSSLGGLISFMLVWEYPEVFSKAACLSPAFQIEDIDFIDNVSNYNGSKKEIKIYIDNGSIGLEEKLQPGINKMLEELKVKGFIYNKDLYYIKDDLAEHNESAWAKRVHLFLEYLFPVKK